MIKKEVEGGWSFVLPRNFMSILQDRVGIIPLGTSKQFKVKDGKIAKVAPHSGLFPKMGKRFFTHICI
jgi:hypothetical protein